MTKHISVKNTMADVAEIEAGLESGRFSLEMVLREDEELIAAVRVGRIELADILLAR